jgi:hypothetical protein
MWQTSGPDLSLLSARSADFGQIRYDPVVQFARCQSHLVHCRRSPSGRERALGAVVDRIG